MAKPTGTEKRNRGNTLPTPEETVRPTEVGEEVGDVGEEEEPKSQANRVAAQAWKEFLEETGWDSDDYAKAERKELEKEKEDLEKKKKQIEKDLRANQAKLADHNNRLQQYYQMIVGVENALGDLAKPEALKAILHSTTGAQKKKSQKPKPSDNLIGKLLSAIKSETLNRTTIIEKKIVTAAEYNILNTYLSETNLIRKVDSTGNPSKTNRGSMQITEEGKKWLAEHSQTDAPSEAS